MASQQDKDFRTEIPNIIDDLGLDPHERALYVHYKRSCGGNDCEWTESVRLTAQRTKMSHTRASQARAALVKRGLITVTGKGNDGTAVKVVDVWKLNNAYYSYKDGRPNIDGWTIGQLSEWVTGVNNIYTLDQEEAKKEPIEPLEPVGVNNMNTSVNNIYNKKEPLEDSLPIGNGVKPPAVEKPKAEKAEPGPKTIVKEKFIELTHLPEPKAKSPTDKLWWGKFSEILSICDKDPGRAVSVMGQVISYMRANRLTISGPQSIVNLCRTAVAGQLNGSHPAARGQPPPPTTGPSPSEVDAALKAKIKANRRH